MGETTFLNCNPYEVIMYIAIVLPISSIGAFCQATVRSEQSRLQCTSESEPNFPMEPDYNVFGLQEFLPDGERSLRDRITVWIAKGRLTHDLKQNYFKTSGTRI